MKNNLVLAVLATFAFAGSSLAQGEKVVIVGTVKDASGGVMAGVEVSLKRLSTNEVFDTLTTDTGDYAFRALVPDVYDMKVSMAGFKTETRPQQRLQIGRTYRIDVQLSVGQVSEQVEVRADAPILRTETPELSQVIDNNKIMGLPLNNRDIFGALGALTPGVQPTRQGGTATNGGIKFNVKGMRQGDNLGMIDGSMISETNGSSQFNINPDAVQEFEIKTGLYGADYGVKPGGQFSIVTKSGTNELHGTAFEYLRNNHLDARNFFTQGQNPQFKRNQFGGVAGGPIYIPKLFNGKDKAWWFFSYNGQRIRRFLPLTATVPTAQEKTGVFAAATTDRQTGLPFPNNTIPASRISALSQKFLPFYPSPNTAGLLNFTSSTSSPADQNQIIAKVDIRDSKDSRWSARFLWDAQPITFANVLDSFTVINGLSNWAQNITNERTIKRKVVNEFGIHFYRRMYFPGDPAGGPADFGRGLTIPGFPARTIDYVGVPTVGLTGYPTIGSRSLYGPVPEGQWEVKDSASWTKGSHLMKVGYHMRHHFFVEILDFRSSFSFTNDRFARNSFANFLLGDLTNSVQGAEGRMNTNFNSHFFFYQDNWKVSQKLSLTLGLRYELRLGWKDKRGYLTNVDLTCVKAVRSDSPVPGCFNPPLVIADPVFPATGRFQANQTLFNWTKNGWQPRMGLSYRLSAKTVIRAGGGIYGNEPPGGMIDGGLLNNPRPNNAQRTFTADLVTPIPFANPFAGQVPGAALPNIFGFQNPVPQWNVYNWGLSVQRQLSPLAMFEVAYQGAQGVHEIQVTEFNDALPGAGSRQSRRPFPGLQTFRLMMPTGNRNYHGLETRLEKRPGPEGVTALLAYTWSKSLDTIGGRLGVPGDPGSISRNISIKSNYGRGEADIPGRFSLMGGYDFPFGTGRKHLVDSPLGKVVGGWNVNAIVTAQRGQWLTATDSDRLDVGSAVSQRPRLVKDPNLATDQRTPVLWFDTTAFAVPPQYQYGDAGRGIIEGPGLFNIDLAVIRNFQLSERARMEFRFEAFNVTNHSNFNIPQTSFVSPSFGVIGAAFEARDLQFGLKVYF